MTDVTTARPVASRAVALPEVWNLRAVDGPVPADIAGRTIPARVPGLVHVSLLEAGLIPDPFLDRNEHQVTWIGQSAWEYATSFTWEADGQDRHELVFEGLDTFAEIVLNGHSLGRTRNQHRTYRFGVDEALREGENELVVTFASPVAEADRASLEIGYRPHTYFHPFNAVRKAACNFGWDWGLDAASSGIWKQARLEAWSGARLAAARPVVTVEDTTGVVSVHVEIERADESDYRVLVALADGRTSHLDLTDGATAGVVELRVADVELWWPRGFGEQPLYDLSVTLEREEVTLAERTHRIGFRTVDVQLERDDEGTSFRFVVNGEPVWIRGANWIPDDAFVTRVTRERLAHRLDQAEFANMNLLRIWGGGYYESDDFYDLCDERGILVWQDFLFACASYAEEEPLWSEVEAEARDNIARIMPHPSLALWNGNNENVWGYEEWGWAKRLQGRTWGLGYYLDLLPRLVAELDPARSYTPASPWSGDPSIFANDPDYGSVHLWELWNRVDYPAYRDIHARFVAEFGWQGPATWSSITRAISDSPLTPESPGMFHHQKATDGNDKLTDGLVAHLPLPDTTEDWHWAMSLNQALAVTVAIEHMRSESPRCMGSVVWQLNDCWPVTSWAAVDGYGRAKPLLYALRHVYADRLLTVQPRHGGLAAIAVNDTSVPWSGPVVARRLSFDGTVRAEAHFSSDIDARGEATLTLPDDVAVPVDAASELIVVESAGTRAFWFFAEHRDSALARAEVSTSARRTASGVEITVEAHNLVRDIALLVDKVDPAAVVDDMLVTLLPGESVTFRVQTDWDGEADRFCAPDVLRSSNQLVADWN
ncbi:glycoside hydrolase family 2 protein [Microbacterium enclense]|uniref:glycoside hydrolase family 2 protein n=1 Tax=Microbacterium enclense TaxID=993073 RepID=UPI0021A73D2F|nr:glycoside hydrolase family 2 TIM barrel-domain containing protein [Microbacterium enclense]MCT2085103.1 glycoside hydrolase family 2 protein [Microbacterium enclense]